MIGKDFKNSLMHSPTGYGLATIEAGYSGLRLRHVKTLETFSFSRRTKDFTSAFVTKIVCSSVSLARCRAADKLSVFGVAHYANSLQMGSGTDGTGAIRQSQTGAGTASF